MNTSYANDETLFVREQQTIIVGSEHIHINDSEKNIKSAGIQIYNASKNKKTLTKEKQSLYCSIPNMIFIAEGTVVFFGDESTISTTSNLNNSKNNYKKNPNEQKIKIKKTNKVPAKLEFEYKNLPLGAPYDSPFFESGHGKSILPSINSTRSSKEKNTLFTITQKPFIIEINSKTSTRIFNYQANIKSFLLQILLFSRPPPFSL